MRAILLVDMIANLEIHVIYASIADPHFHVCRWSLKTSNHVVKNHGLHKIYVLNMSKGYSQKNYMWYIESVYNLTKYW